MDLQDCCCAQGICILSALTLPTPALRSGDPATSACTLSAPVQAAQAALSSAWHPHSVACTNRTRQQAFDLARRACTFAVTGGVATAGGVGAAGAAGDGACAGSASMGA